MEKIVFDKVTRFFEVHKLLPDNQHGFRAKRSTMTALAEIQRDWTKNTKDKRSRGLVLGPVSSI